MRIRALELLAAVALLGYAACAAGEQSDTDKAGAEIRQLWAQDKLLRAHVSTLKKKVAGLEGHARRLTQELEGRVRPARGKNGQVTVCNQVGACHRRGGSF